jgi:hypothetical protein
LKLKNLGFKFGSNLNNLGFKFGSNFKLLNVKYNLYFLWFLDYLKILIITIKNLIVKFLNNILFYYRKEYIIVIIKCLIIILFIYLYLFNNSLYSVSSLHQCFIPTIINLSYEKGPFKNGKHQNILTSNFIKQLILAAKATLYDGLVYKDYIQSLIYMFKFKPIVQKKGFLCFEVFYDASVFHRFNYFFCYN